jgi:hypothetical protein
VWIPGGQDHELLKDEETFVDSSLSADGVVAQIATNVPRSSVDFSGYEDDGIDGFSPENSYSTCVLGPFNAQIATSYWPRWDGHATST